MKASLIKKIAKGGLILGASVFVFAGAANAATYVNLYGASAQFNFWTNYAPTMLHDLGCAAGAQKFTTTDGNSGVAIGTSCPSSLSSDNGTSDGIIYFSYTNKASWDGIDAVLGFYDLSNNASVANTCSTGAERPVATCNNSSCSAGVTYTCQTINIGTSDVEASAFSQQSNGTQFGPANAGGPQLTRAFTQTNGSAGISVSALPPSNHYQAAGSSHKIQQPETPIAYPFSFYVNPGVKSYTCTSVVGTAYFVGSDCADDAQCGGTAGGHTNCTSGTINNLTRLQVVGLFSGIIADWSNFGASYPAQPVTLCMRHAGSGTSATLDWGIMEGNGWENGLAQYENRANTASPPYIYFNDGTGDLRNCLKWANGDTSFSVTQGYDALATGEQGGAVGYMDSDNANTTDYVQVKFNGVYANRLAMHDGIYDNFWTINRMYVPFGLTAAQVSVYQQILNELGNPANITNATVGSTRGNFYGSSVELNFTKTNSTVYPYSYSPVSGANEANPN